MKRTILSFIIAVFAVSGMAQSWNENSIKNNMVTINYNPMTLVSTTEDFHSLSLEITELHSLSSKYPFYLDAGFGLGTTFGSKITNGKSNLDGKESFYFVSAKIPLNFGYKIDLNEDCFIFPFMGIYLRGNITGHYIDGSYDALGKSTVGKENTFNYFQAGYSYGIKLAVGRFCLGVAYEKDVNDIAYETKSASNKISFGYRF